VVTQKKWKNGEMNNLTNGQKKEDQIC